jgi:lysophospholipase L1-like esterase
MSRRILARIAATACALLAQGDTPFGQTTVWTIHLEIPAKEYDAMPTPFAGGFGRTPGDGKILRYVDRDGDGRVDEVTVFAKVDHSRGVVYRDGKLWVMHPPTLSVFEDTDGDGVADRQEVLVTGLTTDQITNRGGDHTSNCVAAVAQTTTQAVTPIPRKDANSKTAHEQLLEKTKKGRIDVYFVGDSITRRWGATDYPDFLANWKENFHGWNAANFGWGGDTVQNVLWRLTNGEMDGVKPKVIVVMAGTNNIGGRLPAGAEEAKVGEIVEGLKATLDVCRDKAPEAVVILMGITPRNDNPGANAVIDKVNDRLAKLADGKKVRFLNINDKLADRDGKLLEGMSPDRLHLSKKGYQVWADALKPIFTELLGPPGKEDLAPPPTGDPSAAKKK